MFTLVICLVVVALSAAAVLRITLVDPTKRATIRARQPRDPRPPRSSVSPRGSSPEAVPADPTEVRPSPASEPAPAPSGRTLAAPVMVIDVHRGRSAGLLLLLLTVLGGVIALVVAAGAVAAVVALRAALVG